MTCITFQGLLLSRTMISTRAHARTALRGSFRLRLASTFNHRPAEVLSDRLVQPGQTPLTPLTPFTPLTAMVPALPLGRTRGRYRASPERAHVPASPSREDDW